MTIKKPKLLSRREIQQFRKQVYGYYRKYGRILPWRKTHDPYHILISELMLQQTRVPRVLQKYPAFLHAFPDIASVADAPLRELLNAWQGLGYNRRALALKKLAEKVMTCYDGRVPSSTQELAALPGIGIATAQAIRVFALNQPAVFIETNIRSVFIHHFFGGRTRVKDGDILPLAEQTLDAKKPRIWYAALMDYGVSLKKAHSNPGRKSAHYTKQAPFRGSNRQVRGMILKVLSETTRISEGSLVKTLQIDKDRGLQALDQLCKEGLVTRRRDYYSIGP